MTYQLVHQISCDEAGCGTEAVMPAETITPDEAVKMALSHGWQTVSSPKSMKTYCPDHHLKTPRQPHYSLRDRGHP